MKQQIVKCNVCDHVFKTRAQIKNIRCPKCKSNQSLSIRTKDLRKEI